MAAAGASLVLPNAVGLKVEVEVVRHPDRWVIHDQTGVEVVSGLSARVGLGGIESRVMTLPYYEQSNTGMFDSHFLASGYDLPELVSLDHGKLALAHAIAVEEDLAREPPFVSGFPCGETFTHHVFEIFNDLQRLSVTGRMPQERPHAPLACRSADAWSPGSL